MAAMRPHNMLLYVVLLIVMLALSHFAEGRGVYVHRKDCRRKCDFRCSKTHHKKPCKFYCNKCCKVCLCVPPGTYGHKHLCPCYNNWKTQLGGPKCP
ncbi:Gibberellin-regulated family protein [Zostera marina]|uniref:Gibberellin-regulated family protein n=1 Tax=Zostera marina TaxID=29655 RepID=A0A0K9PV64_ZOSMR|nr:Gibberellin-regulated family protein [Zostera marina]